MAKEAKARNSRCATSGLGVALIVGVVLGLGSARVLGEQPHMAMAPHSGTQKMERTAQSRMMAALTNRWRRDALARCPGLDSS